MNRTYSEYFKKFMSPEEFLHALNTSISEDGREAGSLGGQHDTSELRRIVESLTRNE